MVVLLPSMLTLLDSRFKCPSSSTLHSVRGVNLGNMHLRGEPLFSLLVIIVIAVLFVVHVTPILFADSLILKLGCGLLKLLVGDSRVLNHFRDS